MGAASCLPYLGHVLMLIAEAQELHWAQAVQQCVLPESVTQHLLFLTDIGPLTFFFKKKNKPILLGLCVLKIHFKKYIIIYLNCLIYFK